MGCSCSKYEVITEEKLIMDSEKSIGFYQHTSATIDLYFRKYSLKGAMNTSQLTACLDELNIDTSDSAERPNVKRFLNKFTKGSTVNLRKLLIYGILCGNSPKEEKALLMFQVYDPMCKRIISRKDVNSLVSMIFSLCLKRCMYLFSSLFTLEENRKIVKKYIYKCQYAMPYCKSEALECILRQNEEFDLSTFETRIMSYKDGALMNPSDLRIVTFNYYVQKKPQKPVNLSLGAKKRKKSVQDASKIAFDLLEKHQSSHNSKQQQFARRRSVTQKAPDIRTKSPSSRSSKRHETIQSRKTQSGKLEPSSPSTLNNSSFSSSTTNKHVLLGHLKSFEQFNNQNSGIK
jgi:hypothetical protein